MVKVFEDAFWNLLDPLWNPYMAVRPPLGSLGSPLLLLNNVGFVFVVKCLEVGWTPPPSPWEKFLDPRMLYVILVRL